MIQCFQLDRPGGEGGQGVESVAGSVVVVGIRCEPLLTSNVDEVDGEAACRITHVRH